jgi:hypothetical protein
MAKTGRVPTAHRRQDGPPAALDLPPSWVAANQRRVQLLRKRRTKAGLSPAEAAELRQIEDLTSRYLDAAAPISFEVIEDLKRAVEEAERRAGRSRNKAG